MPVHELTRRRLIAGLPLVATAAADEENWSDPKSLYTIPGLPQSRFNFEVSFNGAKVYKMRFAGTVAYVIEPTGAVDSQRRWIWVSPMFLAMNAALGGVKYQYYVEAFAAAGFHVVGVDVGASLGSPRGAEIYQRFYQEIVLDRCQLHPKARLLGQSNGGLITYGWAFRHPEHVDRIYGLMPATDLRSWPGLNKVVGKVLVPQPPDMSKGRIAPEGLGYPVETQEELLARLAEFNPIDRLAPLAKAGVKIAHLHGDADTLVPMGPNSEELVKRYRALGGEADLEVVNGLSHGGPMMFRHQPLLKFLLG